MAKAATARAAAPPRVRVDTARFRLSGIAPQELTERYCDWLADPQVALPLNRRPGRIPLETLRREFAQANGTTVFYVVIFADGEVPIGYYKITRDPVHRNATFNVLVGETEWWGKGVVLETRAALLDHFFAERDVEKACGMPFARNIPSVFNYRRQGWRLEGTLRGHCRAVDGGGRLDQLQFGLLADEWARLRSAGS